jgi:hypothetical protein
MTAGCVICLIQNGELRVGVDHGSRRIAIILDGLRTDNLQVTDITMTRPSLGDVFSQPLAGRSAMR